MQLSICLIGSLLLSGCAGLKPFPADTLIEYDAKNKVCGEYRITDPENLKFKYVKDISCPSIFGFTSRDVPKVLNWATDAKEYVRSRCQ